MTRLTNASLFLLATILCTNANYVAAGSLEDGRLAIIHADQSVLLDDNDRRRPTDFLKKLGEAGVQVIGRYYGRCRQSGFEHKLLVNGGSERDSEANAILDAGFAIISFYQYKTNDDNAPSKFTIGLPDRHDLDQKKCEQTAYAKSHPVAHSAADEGALDAQAAVAQAHAVHQPPNTPIYFGMDFDYDTAKKKTPALNEGIVSYFNAIRAELKKPENGYLVGAYGDGGLLSFLLGLDKRSNGEGLIEFSWLSPSRSYTGTPEFTKTGPWNVLQSISDSKVLFTQISVCIDLAYDGDIQNDVSGYEYAGAWTRLGRYVVTAQRTKAIYDQHGYICRARGVNRGVRLQSCQDKGAVVEPCTDFCSARVVRLKPGESGPSNNVAIDVFGYAKFDGYAPAAALSPSLAKRPHYSLDPNEDTCD